MLSTWVDGLLVLATALGSLAASRSLFHYFQLESYQFPGYFRTLERNKRRALAPGMMMTVFMTAVLAAQHTLDLYAGETARVLVALCVLALSVLAGIWCRAIMMDKKAKKPMVVTARVKRLYGVAAVVYTLVCLAVAAWIPWPYALCLFPLLLPLWAALAGLLAWPIEKLISEMYFRDAQHKLAAQPGLIRIGITGSYGKTSVKFILGTMLSEKYQVLITPSSFNTPMGVTRIIREKLLPTHQVFVAEMGARHVGDIREMCRLVHPTYGVLTSVGPQHLETFKTLERIKSTKYELMDAIPAEGCCFFPDDGAICRELYDRTTKAKRLSSMQKDTTADVWAENRSVSPAGSRFDLCTKDGRIACETQLLGEHNIQNILLASSVCLHLGLTLKQVARGIAKLVPVEHRLQLMPTSGGLTVIDDAFNSNPKGAEAALRVIAGFGGRRIIITPGMVELGAGEAEYNRAFGEKMAGAVDVAILVGKKHTQPIAEGLRAAGFPDGAVYTVGSLDEAAALLRKIGQSGDVALFENDLPDHYAET